MTKPLISALLLILAEEGRCLLEDPIDRFLPEFSEMKVLTSDSRTTPAARKITILDLLRHTSGFGGGVWGTQELTRRYREQNIPTFEHLCTIYDMPGQEIVERLARVPLAHQPGTVWEYGKSGDVLGRVIEAATGRHLDEVLREKLTNPLDMHDTVFFLTHDQAYRLASPSSGQDHLDTASERPNYLSGGSGAFASVLDYAAFGQVLLDRRDSVLKRTSIDLMTTNHINGIHQGPDYIPGSGYGFGLGVAVRGQGGSSVPGSPGDIYWLGRLGTCFLVDPREELVAVLMLQRRWYARHYHQLFRGLVYQTLA